MIALAAGQMSWPVAALIFVAFAVGSVLWLLYREANPLATGYCPHCAYTQNRAGYPICQRCHRDRSKPIAVKAPAVVHVVHHQEPVPEPAPAPTRDQRIAAARAAYLADSWADPAELDADIDSIIGRDSGRDANGGA